MKGVEHVKKKTNTSPGRERDDIDEIAAALESAISSDTAFVGENFAHTEGSLDGTALGSDTEAVFGLDIMADTSSDTEASLSDSEATASHVGTLSDTADADADYGTASVEHSATDSLTAPDSAVDAIPTASEPKNPEGDEPSTVFDIPEEEGSTVSGAEAITQQSPENTVAPDTQTVIEFPITDDEFTARSLDNDTAISAFPITDDEFTARALDNDTEISAFPVVDTITESEDSVRQASISDIDENIPELSDVRVPQAVEIPSGEDDEPIPSPTKKKEDEKKTRPIDNRFDFLELFVFTLVAVLVLTTFVFRHSIVDGGSMERTLFDGEHLIISDFFYTPSRGDIIVFQDYSKAEYSQSLAKPLVKRVIAIGGDTVRVYRDGRVYVNDLTTPLDESDYTYNSSLYYNAIGSYADRYIPNFEYYPSQDYPDYIECTVPEGEVFVMGDHRDGSTDSRDFGTVSTETILGRVLLRFYPFESFGKVE